MTFRQHGTYRLNLRGNILFIEAVGAWNAEASINIMRDIKQCTAALHHNKWAMHIDVRSWELGTPDFEKVTEQELKELLIIGLKRSAYVIDQGVTKLRQISAVQPDPEFHTWQFFSTYQQALDWLIKQGFSYQPPTSN